MIHKYKEFVIRYHSLISIAVDKWQEIRKFARTRWIRICHLFVCPLPPHLLFGKCSFPYYCPYTSAVRVFSIRIQWPYNLHRLCHAAFPINVELKEGVVHGVGETNLSVEVMIFLAILSIHDLLTIGKTNTNPEASGSSLRLKLNVERLIPVIQ